MNNDISSLRECAKRVMEIAQKPVQEERKKNWSRLNSFQLDRPLIYVRAFAFEEFFEKKILKCIDPFLRTYETLFHMHLFRDAIKDDYIIEPWVRLKPVFSQPNIARWGVKTDLTSTMAEDVDIGYQSHVKAAAFDAQIIEEEDVDKLIIPKHAIDEKSTKLRYEILSEAIGDIIPVALDRGPQFKDFTGDISADLAKIRGLEQIMWDVSDRPEWLHKLIAFMRDGILKCQNEAEEASDYSLINHENQAMPYATELMRPKNGVYNIKRNELWGYMASQEFTMFGPEMFDEFLLQYQLPILKKYALVAYGCCEDLSQKIDKLKQIPNLRRISVSPFANVRKCAEKIGSDYIISFRPNPSTMIANGLDEEYLRTFLKGNFEILKLNKCRFDITLKDVETVNKQPENVMRWVQIVREEIERAF